jgi:hypothetical protein
MVAPPSDHAPRPLAESAPSHARQVGCGDTKDSASKCECNVSGSVGHAECEARGDCEGHSACEGHGECQAHGSFDAHCACEGHGECQAHCASESHCEFDDCEGICDCDGGIDATWIDEHAPAVDTPTPDAILESTLACLRFVKDALGVELDFTPETLPILDHYLLAARETLSDRPELRELVWRCAGAYFGELVRRRYNGFWLLPNADVHTWRLNQSRVLLSFNPIGIVAEAVAGSDNSEGPEGALRLAHADQEEVAIRLAQTPALPEDQYYLLSTRLEVIDTVVEHLRLRMEQNDQADVEFDPDDYINDLNPYGRA